MFLVEISEFRKKKVVICLFEDYDMPKKHLIEVLPIKVYQKLLQDSGNLYESFIQNRIYLKFGRM